MVDVPELERKFAAAEKLKGEEKLGQCREILASLHEFEKAAASDWENYKRDMILLARDLNTKVTSMIHLLEATTSRRK